MHHIHFLLHYVYCLPDKEVAPEWESDPWRPKALCNVQDFKDLLLMSCCQIPEDSCRDFMKTMPQRFRGVLAAKGDLHSIRQVL